MGLFKKSCYTNSSPTAVQPDPLVWNLVKSVRIGDLWVSVVRYPNCTNYEGEKIIVTSQDPKNFGSFDPHFRPGGPVVARFEPTRKGERNAIAFARAVMEK